MQPAASPPEDLEDDYADNGYLGDPGDGAPVTAAPDTTTAAEESGYDGDTETPEEQQEQVLNPAASGTLGNLYNLLGLENGQVDIDGQQRDFASLSAEDQAEVFNDQLEQVREETRQQTLRDFGLSAEELALVDHYRAHGTVAGLESPALSSLTTMSHDDLHRQQIRALLGENASEQQVEAELATRRTGTTFAAQAEHVRSQLVNQATQAEQAAEAEGYQAYTQAITQQVSGIKAVAGIPVEPAHHAYIVQQLTQRPAGGVAPFIAALGDESQLAIIATKALLFDGMVQGFLDQRSQQRGKTIEEVLGVTRQNQQPQGRAPRGQQSGQPQNGHQFTNDELDSL